MKQKMTTRNKTWARIVVFLLMISLLVVSLTAQGQLFWSQTADFFKLSAKPSGEEEFPLNIYCLSVGKADAIVISCEGEYALIDGGTFDKSDDVLLMLNRLGVNTIKTVFATHPDHDHIGGLAQVLNVFPVSQFVQSNFPEKLVEDNTEQQILEQTLLQKNIATTVAQVGEIYEVGSAQIEVLGPVKEYADTNNYSLVLKLTYQEFSMLFCGDIEEKAEEDLLENGTSLSADCIKIAHHGSKTSSSKAFLEAVGAKYAVISTGADNNKLPRSEVLKRIEENGSTIFRTDLDGTVQISSDGEKIWIQTVKE